MPEMTVSQNSAGNGEETLEERIKSLEREKKGILRDLQGERERSHQYEERIARLETALTSAGNDDGEIKPDERVNKLAQDPDSYILGVVKPEIEKRDRAIDEMRWERKIEKAYQWLGRQLKKDPDDLPGSDIDKEILRIVKERGMEAMDPIKGTQAAYEILQQEKKRKEAEEAARTETISANATETVQRTSSGSTRGFTVAQIAAMSREEFDRRYDEIQEAKAKGLITR